MSSSSSVDTMENDSDTASPSRVVLRLRGYHRAMPAEQLKQLVLRDEGFSVPLLQEILRRLKDGFEKYNNSAFHPNDSIANQDAMSEYERLINRFSDVAGSMAGYRVDWAFMESISNVIYPLVCSTTLANRTTSVWTTLVHRLTSIFSTKKAHIVPPFTIPWRPLCDLILEVIGESRVQVEAPSNNRDSALFGKDTLNTLVEGCCRYFDDKAFGEIWEFIKPRFQRRTSEFHLGLLCGLMPGHRCCATDEQRAVAKDVLDTLFDYSEGRFNFLFGFGFQTCDIIYYIACAENIGRFDFSPYAERIFTLNLRMSGLRSDFVSTVHEGFGLPQLRVGVGNAAYFSPDSIGNFKNTSIASAIAFLLPNDTSNVLWSHLKRFLRACETYTCSSSASTKQSKAVAEWVWRFTSSFVERVRVQKLNTYPIPESHVLSEQTIEAYVELMQKHVVERLYRTRGNATELIRLVALSPKSMLPYLQKLVAQGATSGSQTSFPQVALGVIGLVAQQAMFIEDDEVKALIKMMIQSQRDWIIECLEDINGPNFISACNALAGMTCILPMNNIYEDEAGAAMRITQALFKLTVSGGRDDHIATISFLLLFLYRACHQETLVEIAKFVVGELKSKASPIYSERVFLSALSTYIPETLIELYFPVVEEILCNPRSTLQEKKTHMEYLGTLSPGPMAVGVAFAPRIVGCIRSILTQLTSADMLHLCGRLLHSIINALLLPRTDARLDRDVEIDPNTGMFRAIASKEARVTWILPTDESKLLAVNIYADLVKWALEALEGLPGSVERLKKEREALGVPLFDHEEAYTVVSVRRGLTRFLQLCTGDAGRLLLTASQAMGVLNQYRAEVVANPKKVLDDMMSAMHASSYVFPAGVPGAFDTTPEVMQKLQSRLAEVSVSKIFDALLKAASDAEAADDALSMQYALTSIHMLHGVNFSSGANLRDIIKAFKGDPAGLSPLRAQLYFVGAASAASFDVSAYMTRDEISSDDREKLIRAVEHFTNSAFVNVAREAQDILLLHVRHMRVEECIPFMERLARHVADFISAPNDITSNAIAEKNFINAFVVASSLCTSMTPSPIKIMLEPFIQGTVQLKCRPTVEGTIEKILHELLGKLARVNEAAESDALLEVIRRVLQPSFQMTPQKKVMFLDQLAVLRLRRDDEGFVKKLVALSLQCVHFFHNRDRTLVLAAQSAVAGVTNSLFKTRAGKRVVDDGSDPEGFKQSFLATNKLRTMGTITLPKEYTVYDPVKVVTVPIVSEEEANSDANDARQWSLSNWEDWLVASLRRLTVGDCGDTFRTFTLFIIRFAMLTNFAVVPAFLAACNVVLSEYRDQVDTTLKRESGAVVCAFSLTRTIEDLMRVELARIGAGAHSMAFGEQKASAAYVSFLEAQIEAYGDFVEELFLYVCHSTTMTTETFFEFLMVGPIDSEVLKRRMMSRLMHVIASGPSFENDESDEGDNAPAVTAAPTSPVSAKSLFRHFCFLVSLAPASPYETFEILETTNFVMNFLEKRYDLIISESSRSSAIAQQLVDQIGQFIVRILHFAYNWESNVWPFTKGLIQRTENFVRMMISKSIDAMKREGPAPISTNNNTNNSNAASATDNDHGSALAATTISPILSTSENPMTMLSPTAVPPAADDGGEAIKVRAGDTCKFQVLLLIRVLSLSVSQMIEDLFPEINNWLYQTQRWITDDAALSDRIVALSRNIVTRDINKATSHAVVTQLCDILLEVATAHGVDMEDEALMSGDEEDDESPVNGEGGENGARRNQNNGRGLPVSPGVYRNSPQPQTLSPNLTSNTSPAPELPKPSDLGLGDQKTTSPFVNTSIAGGAGGAGSAIPPALLDSTTSLHNGTAIQNKSFAGHLTKQGSHIHHTNISSARRVVLMCTAMLHRTLFLNLHRIGKFAMLQRCADAMSASLGSLSHTSKSNHKMVAKNAIAVLVRVSSDEQISALLNPQVEVLRKAQSTEGGLGAIARSDPQQLRDVKKAVHFLCAVVLAYPEQVPSFCGKILKALAPYGSSPVAEVKNAVSQMFKAWWRTHRERWEYEFKDKFTPAQQAVVMEYWSSSSYYA